ncbi:MAG: formylglycine-generating enzyme family protein [Deltaproteobacteria bacterium]|jgi:formylglycine-generating enzyme required for sulfatase activity|nr:formylglycine-generating enzyme family protein [Deltaproteobacteria bacterium]
MLASPKPAPTKAKPAPAGAHLSKVGRLGPLSAKFFCPLVFSLMALAFGFVWAPKIALAQTPIVTNLVDMTFVWVPKGRFFMGAGPGFQGDGLYERPAHEVSVTKGFRLTRTEVTTEQWNRVMGNMKFYGAKNKKDQGQLPISDVSWHDALAFVERLNELEGTKKYRLPTEAEWEYAARAGSATAYFFGDDPKLMADYAWCGEGFAEGSAHPVGLKKPNAFGLVDMAGNVSEWVQDWFSPDYYANKVGQNPKGPSGGEEKVHRGGAYASDPKTCQSAWRETDLPTVRSVNIGFRVAYDE